MAAAPPIAAARPSTHAVDLRHPMPDLQALQGAYVSNIERLEEHAERMSEAGSDLGEEIRKLHMELKRSDSRRPSLEDAARQHSTQSRNVSLSSRATSIVDVNGAARWGGYSPSGYVTSPVGSLRSNSWSNMSASLLRQRSESKTSRLGQMVHPDDIAIQDARRGLALDRARGSPQSLRSAPLAMPSADSPPLHAARHVSSFSQKYDAIAHELRHELRNSGVPGQPAHHGPDGHADEHRRDAPRDDYPDRPPTAASTDTSRQARIEWQDFDGVHGPDTVLEEEPEPRAVPMPAHSDNSRHSSFSNSMLRLHDFTTPAAPPPLNGMVFYPAPVPRLLNLPKRLSRMPASQVQARRRTQLLDSMQAENRHAAALLGDMAGTPPGPPGNNRSMLNLPPQLRASAYFDNQVAPSHEFAVQGESAQETLDSILNASARAPASAFTDHLFAGHVGSEVYGPDHRQQSKLPDMPPPVAETKRRNSFMMLDTKRNSSGDLLKKLKKRNSSADMNLLVVKASESRMSLGDQLDEHHEHARGPESRGSRYYAQPLVEEEEVETRNPDDVYAEEHPSDDEQEEEEEEEDAAAEESEEEEPPYFGAPTTLLAELQLRKAKQKTRNMNYATMVEQGLMPTHRTLLELDEIAEKEKQKRLKKKVNLAWEAQAEDDDSEDDVPLGVLYKQPNQHSSRDFHRPIGLIAQRELEDREPLSYRRARLRGESPHRRGLGPSPSQMHLAMPTTTTPAPETDEDEGETLGDRMRRLREKKELDDALGDDVRKSTISLDFVSEMMGKLGVSETKADSAPQPTPSPAADEEEETLAQRRARLRAEAAARGDAPAADARPGLRPSMSMADILSANPIDVHNQARKISDQQLISHLPPGSLLRQNVDAEERRKAERLTQTMRASSYGSYDPLVRTPSKKTDDDQPLAMKIQAYKNRMAGVPDQGTHSMVFTNGLATTPSANMSSMNLADRRQSMMTTPMNNSMNIMSHANLGVMSQPNLGMMNMGMPTNMPMNMMNMGMMSQPNLIMGMQPQMAMPMMSGMRASSMMSMPAPQMQMGMGIMNPGMGMGMGMMNPGMGTGMGMMNPGMGMAMGMMMQPPMDPRQRDQIDQWVQGVQH
ncbi:hypothetical protein ACEQ8H_003566 [Pleosporales sp. CAS-2024a]